MGLSCMGFCRFIINIFVSLFIWKLERGKGEVLIIGNIEIILMNDKCLGEGR